MSRFWPSVRLVMAIRQTKLSVLLVVCVSTFLYGSPSIKNGIQPLKLKYVMKICNLLGSFSGQRPTDSIPSTSRSRDCFGQQFICSSPALEPSCFPFWKGC